MAIATYVGLRRAFGNVTRVSRLRVGLFTECYSPIRNGIVASIDSLAHALRDRSHTAIVVTPEMPDHRDIDRDVIRVPSFPLPTRTAYRLTMPFVPRTLGELSIVHAHSPFVTGWLGQRVARRNGIPLVFTYHTQLDAYAHYVPFEVRATRSAATTLTRGYANAADAVVVPTPAMERRLRDIGVRARIDVVPSGIDVAAFAGGMRSQMLRASFGVGPQEKMLLFVGRLGREKNIELLIEAFAGVRDGRARLVAIGDGPHRETLERLVARAGIADRVHFAGELPRERLPDVYASADLFTFPSRTETQGLVLVEALAARLPILAVDTPQTRDVVAGAARLVDAAPHAFARAIEEALTSHDPAAAARSARIAAGFDRSSLGDRMIALYQTLCVERVAARA